MNTGTLQATIAYKVTPDGQPVDVNGQLTSVSGRRQAIALLEGVVNPNQALYEVEFYFSKGGFVGGNPTTEVNLQYCPVSIFTIEPRTVILHPGNVDDVINIFSSFGWSLIMPGLNIVTVSPQVGGPENTPVTLTRTATIGQGYLDFKDDTTGEIIQVYVVNTDTYGWILETGFWQNNRLWLNDGIWNY